MSTTTWDEAEKHGANGEVYGPHIDAPVWPWTLAGWSLAALYILLALAAWLSA
jgi:hypothetical protein